MIPETEAEIKETAFKEEGVEKNWEKNGTQKGIKSGFTNTCKQHSS
jgi:hypothetical protein